MEPEDLCEDSACDHRDRQDAVYCRKADVDDATQQHFVEIDLIAPELAAPDEVIQKQPWFPLVQHATTKFQVYKRGERSFVIVLPKAAA